MSKFETNKQIKSLLDKYLESLRRIKKLEDEKDAFDVNVYYQIRFVCNEELSFNHVNLCKFVKNFGYEK